MFSKVVFPLNPWLHTIIVLSVLDLIPQNTLLPDAFKTTLLFYKPSK